jgi:hypothetical protein
MSVLHLAIVAPPPPRPHPTVSNNACVIMFILSGSFWFCDFEFQAWSHLSVNEAATWPSHPEPAHWYAREITVDSIAAVR